MAAPSAPAPAGRRRAAGLTQALQHGRVAPLLLLSLSLAVAGCCWHPLAGAWCGGAFAGPTPQLRSRAPPPRRTQRWALEPAGSGDDVGGTAVEERGEFPEDRPPQDAGDGAPADAAATEPKTVSVKELRAMKGKTMFRRLPKNRAEWRPYSENMGFDDTRVRREIVQTATTSEITSTIIRYGEHDWEPGTVAVALQRLSMYVAPREKRLPMVTTSWRILKKKLEWCDWSKVEHWHLTAILSAAGHLRISANIYNKFVVRAARFAHEMEPQQIAEICLGVGRMTLHQKDKVAKFFDAAANYTIERREEFLPKEFAYVVLGMAKVGYRHKPMLRAVSDYVVGKLEHFEDWEAESLLDGMSRVGYRHRGFLDDFCDRYMHRLSMLGVNGAERVIGALAVLKHRHDGFLNKATSYVKRNLDYWRKQRDGVERILGKVSVLASA